MALSRASDNLTPESSSAEGLDEDQSTRGESKRKRFHPLRAVRKIFKRRVKREGVDTVSASSKKSRSTSELQAVHDDGHRFQGPAPPYAVGLSVSHDSIFSPEPESPRLDSHDIPGIPGSSLSAHNVAGLQGFQDELFTRVRARRDSDDDIGLPHSPCTSPTTVDVLSQGLKEKALKSHSTCSAGSLASMGSSENDEDSSGHSSRLSLVTDRRSDYDPEAGVDVSQPVPLSHNAARHKIAVRPKRTHRLPRHWRLQQVTNFTGNLPTTPEVMEDSARSTSPQQSFSEMSTSFEDAEEPLSLPTDLSLCSTHSRQQIGVTGAASEPSIDAAKSEDPSFVGGENVPTGPIVSRSKSAAAELKLRHEITQFGRRQQSTDKKSLGNEEDISPPLQIPHGPNSSGVEVIDVRESMKVLEATIASNHSRPCNKLISMDAIQDYNGNEQPVEELQCEPKETEEPLSSDVHKANEETKANATLNGEVGEDEMVIVSSPSGGSDETLVKVVSPGDESKSEMATSAASETQNKDDCHQSTHLCTNSSSDSAMGLLGAAEVIVSADNITTIEGVEGTFMETPVCQKVASNDIETTVEEPKNVEEPSNMQRETNEKSHETPKENEQVPSDYTAGVATENDVVLRHSKPNSEDNLVKPLPSSAARRVSVEIVPFSQRIKDPNYFAKSVKQSEDKTKYSGSVKRASADLSTKIFSNNQQLFDASKCSNSDNDSLLTPPEDNSKTNAIKNGTLVDLDVSSASSLEGDSPRLTPKLGEEIWQNGKTPLRLQDKKALLPGQWEVKIQTKQNTDNPSLSESSVKDSLQSRGQNLLSDTEQPPVPEIVLQDSHLAEKEKETDKCTNKEPTKQKNKSSVVEHNGNGTAEPELFRVFARRSLKHKEVDKKKEVESDTEKEKAADADIINTSDNSTIIRIQEAAKKATADGKEEAPDSAEKNENSISFTKEAPKSAPSTSKGRPKGRFHTTSDIPPSESEPTASRQRKNSAPSSDTEGKENVTTTGKSLDETKALFRAAPQAVTVTVVQHSNGAERSTHAPKTPPAVNVSKDGANLPLWMQLAQQRRELREQRERRLIGDAAPATFVLETSSKPSRSSKVLDMVSNFQKMHLT